MDSTTCLVSSPKIRLHQETGFGTLLPGELDTVLSQWLGAHQDARDTDASAQPFVLAS